MHIGFQRGGGRGVYEVVGNHSGLAAGDLDGWTLYMSWPDGFVRETGLEVDLASGKPRLVSLMTPKFQIGRMVAAMLLLPSPRREYSQTNSDYPVLRAGGYVLSRIGFGPDTEFAGVNAIVTVHPTFLDVDNLADKESLGIHSRWLRIQAVYAAIELLPGQIHELVEQHRSLLATGEPVTALLASVVSKLVTQLAPLRTDGEPIGDPLPALEQLIGLVPSAGPSLPPPDALGEDEPLVSARSAYEYRLAKSRGAGGKRFSDSIRAIYSDRCAFCGCKFAGVAGVRSGVDAAHILAWSKYDLDIVQNGLSLCKLHHWAFDEALLMPVYKDGKLTLAFTELSLKFDADTRTKLGASGFVIPAEWLPADKSSWPSEKYLKILYADLDISFTP